MLHWQDNRWHCDGQPIHAGSTWELKCPDGWLTVRVESASMGRVLIAYAEVNGRLFRSDIHDHDTLRTI